MLTPTARTWKQAKCPLTEEQPQKVWYMHAKEYYSAIKKKEPAPSAATWKDTETVILTEISKVAKEK